MGLSKLNVMLAALAILCFAPWIVYLAGMAKLTKVINNRTTDAGDRQLEYMLEWYEIAAEFFLILMIIVLAFAAQLRRTAGFLQMMLAVQTALIIYSATKRLVQINSVGPGPVTSSTVNTNAVPFSRAAGERAFLRAIAAGQIVTAAWNFLLSIVLGLASTSAHAARAEHKEAYTTEHAVGATTTTGTHGHGHGHVERVERVNAV